MKRARVLLADDHRIFLAGLEKLLEPHFEVAGAVHDGLALLTAARKLQPDVVVADVSMPLLNGIEAVRQLAEIAPTAKVVFLSMHTDALFIREALRAGGSAYVLKRDAPDQLVAAIREVLKQRHNVSSLASNQVGRSARSRTGEKTEFLDSLTSRQRQILQLVAEGRTLKEIGAILHVSAKTVEFHKYRLMQQLGSRTNADLTAIAIRHGLIAP